MNKNIILEQSEKLNEKIRNLLVKDIEENCCEGYAQVIYATLFDLYADYIINYLSKRCSKEEILEMCNKDFNLIKNKLVD